MNCLADLYAAMAIRKACDGPLGELIVPPPGYPRPDRQVLEDLLASVTLRMFDEVENA